MCQYTASRAANARYRIMVNRGSPLWLLIYAYQCLIQERLVFLKSPLVGTHFGDQ